MYVRPAHFDLPCADRLTQSTASQAVYRLARDIAPAVNDRTQVNVPESSDVSPDVPSLSYEYSASGLDQAVGTGQVGSPPAIQQPLHLNVYHYLKLADVGLPPFAKCPSNLLSRSGVPQCMEEEWNCGWHQLNLFTRALQHPRDPFMLPTSFARLFGALTSSENELGSDGRGANSAEGTDITFDGCPVYLLAARAPSSET
jgi:hypothetical protein